MHCKHSHSNPTQWAYASQTWTDHSLRLGDFSLSPVFLDKVTAIRFHHGCRWRTELPPCLQLAPWQPVPLHASKPPAGFILAGNYLYQSAADQPTIGDLRIRFEYAGKTRGSDATVLSVVGVQSPQQGIEEYTVGVVDVRYC